jgi:hypothetical protein
MSGTDTIYQQVREHLHTLGLTAAADRLAPALEQADREKPGYTEFLHQMLTTEVTALAQRRLAGRLRFAKLPARKTIEQFDFAAQPSLDRRLIDDLATLRPGRNIRANELDEYVFAQVRQALLDPRALIAGEHAVITGAPIDENELIANQITRITNAIAAAEVERSRLLDAYQAGLLELDELTRRTSTVTTRREQLLAEKTTLTQRTAELATENRLRRGLASFAERVAASLDELDPDARQRLMRLVVEKVRVTGWRVEIHLKIPLADDGPDNDTPPDGPTPKPGPSSDMRLRSLRVNQRRQLPHARPPRRHPSPPTRDHRWGKTMITPEEFPEGVPLTV